MNIIMQKILITGINGFVGRHLIEYILKMRKNVVIFGGDKRKLKTKNEKLKTTIQNLKSIKFFKIDIRNKRKVENLIQKIKPSIIFHLAAISSGEGCKKDKKTCFEVNINGTKNLLEALVKHCPDSTVLIPSSSEVYRKQASIKKTIKEDDPLASNSYYAKTKKIQEDLGLDFYKKFGLKTIIVRTFNIIGEREISDEFDICTKIAKTIAAAEKNQETQTIKVYQNNKSDFIDVKDAIRAYLCAVCKCEPGEIYNICGKKSYRLRDIFNKFDSLSNKKFKKKRYFKVINNKSPSILLGDNSKFRRITGWRPEINILNQTLLRILNHWRKKF